MAIKNKFIHFKTRAAFNANVPNPALTADEGNTFYNYTTFIQDTKEIYTHGTFYKSNTTWDMLKITEDISYAALFKNNAKVGDIVQLEGAMDFIIFSASIDNSSFMSLLQGSTSDINTYIAYYDDSTQLYIFDEDNSLSIANNNNINSIVRSYVEDTYITEKTLEKLPAGTNASITATDSILNAFAKLQGQVNAKANTSSIPTAATVTPKASGTAAVGTSTKYAREDHVHPLQTNVETATKLATPRVIAIAGAVSGSATFDGSSNVSINSTLNGFDASKITSGTLNADRLPEIPISKIPAAAMERLYVVESQSAAMSLTIQEGDVVQIGSGGPMYFCVSESASTFPTKFKVFTAGAATSVPWSGVTGAPTLSLRSLQVNAVGYQVYSNVATSIPMIFAPTEIGTSGQILQSTGNGAPKWVNQSAITAGQANQVLNPFVLKINNGSAEDTSVYTFNGSAGKVLNFVSGSNILLTPTQNKLTISAYIPVATSSTYGGIQIGYTTEDKNYAVQLSHGKAYVNVPWTDTNTNYYPTTFTWTNGTTAGPTGSLTGSGMSTVSFGAIPSASATQSGVVTTGDQSFAGEKIFRGGISAQDANISDLIIGSSLEFNAFGRFNYIATSTEAGGIKIGATASGVNLPLVLNSSNQAYIAVTKGAVTAALGFTPANVNDIPEIPIALPNPYALTINGTSYTGSSAVSISTSKPLSLRMLTSSTIDAGYSYSCSISKAISTLKGFSLTNPDSVIISSAKLTFTASNVIKMDGLDDLSGTWYIYCLSYMANSKIAVNGAVYA